MHIYIFREWSNKTCKNIKSVDSLSAPPTPTPTQSMPHGLKNCYNCNQYHHDDVHTPVHQFEIPVFERCTNQLGCGNCSSSYEQQQQQQQQQQLVKPQQQGLFQTGPGAMGRKQRQQILRQNRQQWNKSFDMSSSMSPNYVQHQQYNVPLFGPHINQLPIPPLPSHYHVNYSPSPPPPPPHYRSRSQSLAPVNVNYPTFTLPIARRGSFLQRQMSVDCSNNSTIFEETTCTSSSSSSGSDNEIGSNSLEVAGLKALFMSRRINSFKLRQQQLQMKLPQTSSSNPSLDKTATTAGTDSARVINIKSETTTTAITTTTATTNNKQGLVCRGKQQQCIQ
jgi:hypothetical protein